MVNSAITLLKLLLGGLASLTLSLHAGSEPPSRLRLMKVLDEMSGSALSLDRNVLIELNNIVDGDGYVVVHDLASGRKRELPKHDGYISSLALSSQASLVATGGRDRTVVIRKVADGKVLHTLRPQGGPTIALAFSPQNPWLATGNTEGFVRVWDISSGSLVRVFPGHAGEVRCLAFSPKGKILASSGDTQTVRLWDCRSGKPSYFLETGADVEVLTFSPDGRWLGIGQGDGSLLLWSMATRKSRKIVTGHKSQVCSIAFSPDSQTLVAGNDTGGLMLWEAKTGNFIEERQGALSSVVTIVFSRGGKQLAAGSGKETRIYQWQK